MIWRLASMKKIKALLSYGILVIIIALVLNITVNAEDKNSTSTVTSITGEELSVYTQSPEKISYGLDVIANNAQMAIAGIKGNPLDFSADRFACAMNLSKIDYITVTKIPQAGSGGLYIGSDSVKEGQKVSSLMLEKMTYEEDKRNTSNTADFCFSVNGSAYEIKCNIYMLDNINYSPTVSLASYASLNEHTYVGINAHGVLSAYDPEGEEMIFEVVKYPSHGCISIDNKNTGEYTYKPDEGYYGRDSFMYVARDKYGNYSSSATVSVNVKKPSTSVVYADMLYSEVYNYAITMTEAGIMGGNRIGDYLYFEPDREVSRAEFVVNAMNAIGINDVPSVKDTGFADDNLINSEMKGYIYLAYTQGYISGTSKDGKVYFNPHDNIKLSEAAVIISNMIGYTNSKYTTVFADNDSIPSWSTRAVVSLYSLGVIEAPDGIVGACECINRGDMAKLLVRTLTVIGK